MTPNHFLRFVVVLMMAALSACASVAELRERPADLTDVVQGNFEFLAKCVANEADSQSGVPPILRIDDTRRIAHVFRVLASGDAAYDITFTQEAQTQVRVEGRGMVTVYGRTRQLEPLWTLIKVCELREQRMRRP